MICGKTWEDVGKRCPPRAWWEENTGVSAGRGKTSTERVWWETHLKESSLIECAFGG